MDRTQVRAEIYDAVYESYVEGYTLNELYDGLLVFNGEYFYIEDRELENIEEALDNICDEAREDAMAFIKEREYEESGDYEKDLKAYEKTIYD